MTNKHVVTAAHCIFELFKAEDILVAVGYTDLGALDGKDIHDRPIVNSSHTRMIIPVAKYTNHPNYV